MKKETVTVNEPGSQVAMGRELGRELVAKWIAEGKQAATTGDVSTLWNSIQWAAYYTGDPAVARWASEGAPQVGATWAGDYNDVLPADQRDDFIGE